MTTTITVTVNPDETLFGTPVLAEASATINGTPATPEAVAIVDGKLTPSFVEAAPPGATVTVGYSNATGAVVNALGTPLAAFSAQPATNATPATAAYTLIARGLFVTSTENIDRTIYALSSDASARRIVVQASGFFQNGNQPSPASLITCTVAGVTATLHYADIEFIFAQFVWVVDIPAGVSGNVVIGRSGGGQRPGDIAYQVGVIPGSATLEAPVIVRNIGLNGTIDLSQTVASGNGLLVASIHDREQTVRTVTWSAPIDAQAFAGSNAGTQHTFGHIAGPLSAGTQTATATITNETANRSDLSYSVEILA